MPQTLSQIYLHVVFTTKGRQPFIDDSLEEELHKYICGVARNHKCPVVRINGMPDHVHILLRLHPTMSTAGLLKELKAYSSGWLRRERRPDFAWQSGYGAFSVSHSLLAQAEAYILKQKEHHTKQTLTEELRAFARTWGLEWTLE